jgi:hypothetical protein
MSADLWLEYTVPGEDEPSSVSESRNVTYNLSPMFREAGYPGHKAMVGAPATEAGGVFRKVADLLEAYPERFKALNPPNGWGDYDLAVEFMRGMARDCALHPHGRLGASL